MHMNIRKSERTRGVAVINCEGASDLGRTHQPVRVGRRYLMKTVPQHSCFRLYMWLRMRNLWHAQYHVMAMAVGAGFLMRLIDIKNVDINGFRLHHARGSVDRRHDHQQRQERYHDALTHPIRRPPHDASETPFYVLKMLETHTAFLVLEVTLKSDATGWLIKSNATFQWHPTSSTYVIWVDQSNDYDFTWPLEKFRDLSVEKP